MKTWLVWESEYPEEGSTEIAALTEKGAARRYRKETGERHPLNDMTPLSVEEATPEILAARAAADVYGVAWRTTTEAPPGWA